MCSVLAWADILAAPGPCKVGAVIPVGKTGLHCGVHSTVAATVQAE